jgi:anaerobic ribonucleoside-triphosphate reductase
MKNKKGMVIIMTKREFLTMIINGTVNEETINYAKDEIEKMDDRNKNRKPSKKVTERKQQDEIDRELILEFLRKSIEPMKTSDIIESIESFKDKEYKVQKITALITPLVKEGKVIKTVIKKGTYYSIA